MDIIEFSGRQLETEDYDKLVEWWSYYRFPPPAREFLPDEGLCGMMVCDKDGNEYCAGFLYETNSKVCWMELIVANPNIKDKQIRAEALRQLIRYLSELAYEWGYKWIFSSVKHEGLKDRYLDCGFKLGTTGANEMIKQL